MAGRIVGLDIGQYTLRAVEVANADKARPTVIRFAEVPVPEGAVESGEVREVNTVATALRRLWQQGGFRTKNVVIGMGNQRVLARDLTVPRAGRLQVREALRFQVQDMLPVPVGEALLDFYPISEGTSEHGPVLNGLLIAAIKAPVMANINSVRLAGLHPVHVDLIPFALSRVLVRGPLARGTVALVDIGASITNVVVATNGVPQFVRMIPVGGEDINKALVARLELSPQQAEAAKRARGFSSAPTTTEAERLAAQVIHETVTELLNSLRNTISYFANTRQNDPVQAIVLAGGASRLSGLAQALGEITKIQIIPGDPFTNIDLSRALRNLESADRQAMTVALGLTLGSVA